MNKTSIEKINIGLVLLSFLLAILLPFELFLFSYAVFGPLHYLTEINWLQKRNYFTSSKTVVWLLTATCILICFMYFTSYFGLFSTSSIQLFSNKYLSTLVTYLILIAFIFVLISEFINKNKYQWLGFVSACVISVSLLQLFYNVHLFSLIFLPTLIHVFVFTLLFIWLGYLKSKSNWSLANILLMIALPAVIFLIPNNYFNFYISTNAIDIYSNTSFIKINKLISDFFDVGNNTDNAVYTSANGLKIQTFISFAYTYHYLNWFSKTNVIGWSKTISKTSLIAILLLWIASISLYAYDYRVGLVFLFAMSLAHVFLEFPLNIKSMRAIFLHYYSKYFNRN